MGQPGRLSPPELLSVALVTSACGGAFTAGHIAVRQIPPYSVAALRYVLASVFLLALLHKRENLPSVVRKLDRKGTTAIALLALVGVVGYNVFLFAGLHRSTPINGSLLAALAPLLTAFLAFLILGEPMRKRQTVGMIISLSGLVVLVSHGSLAVLLALQFNSGDLLIFVAVLCFGLQSIAAKRAMVHTSPFATTAFSCTFGALMLLPLMAYDIVTGAWGTPTLSTWLAIVFLGTIATVVAYLGWFRLVGRHGASSMSPFLNFVAVAGALIGVLAGEQPRMSQVVAGALVLFGVTIATLRPKQPVAAPPRG